MTINTKKIISICLSLASVVGSVSTLLLTRKAAFKEKVIIDKLDGVKISKKVMLKTYTLPILSVTATSAAIIGSAFLNRSIINTLATSLSMSMIAYDNYRKKVKKTVSESDYEAIQQSVIKGELSNIKTQAPAGQKLYYLDGYGMFYAYEINFMDAYICLNESLILRDGYFSLQEFMRILDGRSTKNVTEKILDLHSFNIMGWYAEYMYDVYSTGWVHINTTKKIDDLGREYTVISFSMEPIELFNSDGTLRYGELINDEDVMMSKDPVDETIGEVVVKKGGKK